MARSRNIKPGFFTNDKLADIEPLGRIMFIGLWTIADREGRLEDRPRRIKAEVLPYDDADTESLLNQLVKQGFIIRYEVDGERYIQVLQFNKHQNPHMKESASTIPAPDKHHASTVQVSEKHETSPADSLNLIPDSLNLIPDSLGSAANADAPTPKAKRATQVPDGFTVTDGLEAWGAKQEPPFSPESMRVEVPQFVDYYQAKGETRKDWDASFRTWMRNSRKWTKPSPPPKSGSRITSIDELFATGDDDDRDRSQEDSRNTTAALASDRLGQVGGASMDGRYEEARFRAIAGGRR